MKKPWLSADFYGTETTFHADGSKTVEFRGGYEPRDMTPDELRPWLLLVKSHLDAQRKASCDQPVIAD